MSKQLLLCVAFVLGISATSSSQCVSLFYDGFESGSFSPTWVPGTGLYTNTVPMGSTPAGNYSLSMVSNGTNSFYQGLSATFTAGQPTYMSWWMRTNTTTGANGYVVIGDAGIASDNGIIFCYFNATSQLRFFNTTGYNHPITANTWYHVEARNMNWTTRTSDIYVNNVLILTGWAFRSTTATAIDRIHLHSLVAATAEYDDFVIGFPPVTTTSGFTSASCFGNSDGSATVTVSSGAAPYTYSWSPSGGSGATATGLAAGTYVCTVTDANGCTNATSVTVTEPAALAATTMQTDVSCNGGSNGDATVLISGGTPAYTYSWSPSGGSGATASGLTAGAYICYVTDANGCQITQSFGISEPSVLLAAAANNGSVCPGDTAMLMGTATGGTMSYSYDWMPGNMSGSVASDVPGGTTTYTLTVTDANGCMDTTTTTVVVNAPVVVSLGPDFMSCGNTFLDAQYPGSTYLWSAGSTAQLLYVVATGPYAVSVTDVNGCVGADTINVTINQLPFTTVSASMTYVCAGEPTVSLFGAPAGGTWNGNGVFGNSFEPDTAGVGYHELTYAYTDSLGCTRVDTLWITVDLCLGLTQSTSSWSSVSVYPNPNNGIFEISFAGVVNAVTVEVTDVQGRIVYTSPQTDVSAGDKKQVDLSAQTNGIYFVRIKCDSFVHTTRILLQH